MARKLNFGETMMWLKQFFSSVAILGVLAIFIRYYYDTLVGGVLTGVLGIILGIVYAEWIRRKYGNSAYYKPLYNSGQGEPKKKNKD